MRIHSKSNISSIVIERYKRRLTRENKNWLCIIIGPTGSGKSYSALRLAEKIDKKFDINRVAFSPSEFIDIIKNEKLKRGNIIIWDEAGVSLGSRDFMTKSNKAINYFLQSWRCMNVGLIFTLPSLSMLDSQTRILAHTLMETMKIDKKNKQVILKLMELQYNSTIKKTYRKYIRVLYKKHIYKITKIRVSLPSEELRKKYEEKKMKFLDNLTIDVKKRIENKKEQKKNVNIDNIVYVVLKHPDKFLVERNKRKFINDALISYHFKIPVSTSRLIKNIVEKKLGII